jgi:hypothetical protein
MIIDHRTYTVQHGRMKEYLALFEEHGLPVQQRHLGGLMGYYQSAIGPLNQLIHLWRYEDLADMERRRAARDADPDWAAYLKRSAGMVLLQENKILKPTSFSPPA